MKNWNQKIEDQNKICLTLQQIRDHWQDVEMVKLESKIHGWDIENSPLPIVEHGRVASGFVHFMVWSNAAIVSIVDKDTVNRFKTMYAGLFKDGVEYVKQKFASEVQEDFYPHMFIEWDKVWDFMLENCYAGFVHDKQDVYASQGIHVFETNDYIEPPISQEDLCELISVPRGTIEKP